MTDIDNLDACRDEPSSTDWETEHVFGSPETSVPESYVILPYEFQNQFASPDTHMACTRYGMAHIVEAQEWRMHSETGVPFERTLAAEFWAEYLKPYPSAKKDGASLQSSLKQFKDAKKITGYATSNWLDEAKWNISRNRLIFTGSQDWDWAHVKATRQYRRRTDWRIVWHAICAVGYDDKEKHVICVNSDGIGVFYVPYDLFPTLFTRYAVADLNEEAALISYKQRIMDAISIEDAKKAREAHIWNGTNPTAPATREEVAAMIYRASQK